MCGPPKTLLVSILSLGRVQNILNQLAEIPAWLDAFEQESGIRSHIVVRNNDPGTDFGEVAVRMRAVQADYPSVTCTLISDVPNNGFGAGHNSNIAAVPSDYLLILNDDIGFPHIHWLPEAVRLLATDPRTVCVGATENPRHINFAFGNGLLPGAFHLHAMPYAEASILLFDRPAFERLGGFHDDFRWAMCEDSDLSLRVQQNGLRIAHVSIPHQHWRSMSFNSLPSAVKSSILEHNRAALFANWRDSFTNGRIGRFEVFDLWSDGLGDVFCALPHLLARLKPLSQAQRANIIINTSHPELCGWLGLDGVRVTSVRDLPQLRGELASEGVANLRSMRDMNFSLPFNIHPLLVGALGIDQAQDGSLADFSATLRPLRLPDRRMHFEAGTYCVIHLEFDRNHDGRGLSLSASAELLKLCGTMFDRIVLLGRERRLSASLFGDTTADILDLQGCLSLSQLTAVITQARFFVGIDSFPAHVAQAGGVPAAVFFGAIHPLARVWDEARVWPLLAPLDCIGCYHTHLEASVPFCMRRDVACTRQIEQAQMEAVLAAMIEARPFRWTAARQTFHALQARLIRLARYHPAPPERLFRTQIASNEQMSNMIYQMTEQMGSLLNGHYHSAAVTSMAAELADLQAELYAVKTAADEARRLRPAMPDLRNSVTPVPATQILQLSALPLRAIRCHTRTVEQWVEVEAVEDDPQIDLPLLKGGGGKVQLRLSCAADSGDAVQIYWYTGEAGFSAEQVHTMPSSGALQTANLVFDLAVGEILRIRIDPTTGVGRARLRGSLGGLFDLVGHETEARPVVIPVKVRAADKPKVLNGTHVAAVKKKNGAIAEAGVPAARTRRRTRDEHHAR